MIKLNGYTIIPTIFPDKTSQVWKIPEEVLLSDVYRIQWTFESEVEIVHLLQLSELVKAHLFISYLPYARQDKEVSNNSTFALKTLIKMLQLGNFCSITVTDPHNSAVLPSNWTIDKPDQDIQHLVDKLEVRICYPDKGAAKRYNIHSLRGTIIADKVRNQLTGEIEGMVLDHDKVNGAVLIVDDICDGGKTFIEASNLLYKAGASDVYLYTTHGIYSKGIEILKNANIKRIFNKNGEI